MTQLSGIPILSPVLFMHVGDPYIPLFCKFEEFLIYLYIISVIGSKHTCKSTTCSTMSCIDIYLPSHYLVIPRALSVPLPVCVPVWLLNRQL